MSENDEFREVSLNDLFVGELNVRRDLGEMEDLVNDIKTRNIQQPILVRPTKNGRFEVIAGRRRFEAAQRAGLKKIMVRVVDAKVADVDCIIMSLQENLQRNNLQPFELGSAYQRLAKLLGGINAVAVKLGVGATTIKKAIYLVTTQQELSERGITIQPAAEYKMPMGEKAITPTTALAVDRIFKKKPIRISFTQEEAKEKKQDTAEFFAQHNIVGDEVTRVTTYMEKHPEELKLLETDKFIKRALEAPQPMNISARLPAHVTQIFLDLVEREKTNRSEFVVACIEYTIVNKYKMKIPSQKTL